MSKPISFQPPRLRSLLLIAEREFKTYVATPSFWVALVLGPLLMAVAVAALGAPSPLTVRIVASDSRLHDAASIALAGAGPFERRAAVEIPAADAAVTLRVSRVGPQVRLESSDPAFPSASGRVLMRTAVERELAMDTVRTAGLPEPRGAWAPAPPAATVGAPAIARVGLVMMLWTTLAGSLGMLLQATVRERVNRSLESLLSAASAMEIVVGKLLGIGAVSMLVLAAWLVSSLALTAFTPQTAGGARVLLAAIADPVLLLKAAGLYGLAFGLFGTITIAVGSVATDAAGAQNQSRPMFAVLLAVFFVSMTTAFGGAGGLHWLVYAPPFTPFMLLLNPTDAMTQAAAAMLLVLVTVAAAFWAARGLSRGTLLPVTSRDRSAAWSTQAPSAN